MNDRNDLDLLADVVKLLARYGPERFESLATKLSSPEFSAHLAAFLSNTARIGREAKITGKAKLKQSPQNFRSTLIELEKTSPEKANMVLSFYDQLMAKTALPSLRDVQAFVSDSGLVHLRPSSRGKAIIPLIKALLDLPYEEAKAKISSVKLVPAQGDRSLAGWSKIILEGNLRSKARES